MYENQVQQTAKVSTTPALQETSETIRGLNNDLQDVLQSIHSKTNNIKNYRTPANDPSKGTTQPAPSTFHEEMELQLSYMRSNLNLAREIERGLREIVG